MKTVITSSGSTLDSKMDRRFGRCSYFVIFDSESGSIEFIPNGNADSVDGAGVASARLVASKGVEKVVSGEFGNKVKNIFDSIGMQLVMIKEDKTIREIIDLLKPANKSIVKKRFAIPLENGVLCSHFGHCTQFAIVDTEDNKVIAENLVTPPPHKPGLLPAWLHEKNVTDVISGGMGQHAQSLFAQNNIKVYVGADPKSAKELVQDFLNECLETGSNRCDH
jgi:predicted Fe-Mo cluster-binding NifX family protein